MADVFEVERNQDICIIHLKLSQIDMFNVSELMEELGSILDENPRFIILNMGKTQFIDSSGMGGLIRLHQQAKNAEGNIFITGLNPRVANLMRLTRSYNYLNCFDTLELALEAAR